MELESFTDLQLLMMFIHGRQDAFSLLFSRYAGPLYGLLRRITHSEPDAEELLQDVFLRVSRAADQFESGSFRAWIYRIAVNRARTWLKRSARSPVIPLVVDVPAPEHHQPQQVAEASESLGVFQRCVSRLPEDLRLAFVLKEMEGFSQEDAAEILGIPLGTLKVHVHRARLSLRQAMTRAALAAQGGGRR